MAKNVKNVKVKRCKMQAAKETAITISCIINRTTI